MEYGQQKPQPQQQSSQQADLYIVLMIGLAVMLGFISLYMPGIGVIAAFIYPIPLAMLTFRRGLAWGVIGIIVATLLISLFSDPFTAAVLSVQYGIVGLFLAVCFRQKLQPSRILVGGIILAAALSVAAVAISGLASGLTVIEMYDSYVGIMRQVLDQSLSEGVYQGISLAQYKDLLVTTFQQMLPALMIIYAMVMAAIEYLIIVNLARRLDPEVPKLPPFASWRLNWQLVWIFIIAIIINTLSQNFAWPVVRQITANIMYVFYPLLGVCGLAFIYWLLMRFNMAGRLITVMLAIVLFNFFLYFLLIVAVADPIFDLRKRLSQLFEKN